jgi:PAS domain S-box-containing protein
MNADRQISGEGGFAEPDFRLLFSAVPGAFLVLLADSPTFTIVAASDAYLAALKKSREEMLGRGVFEVFPEGPDPAHAETHENVRASFEQVISSRQTDNMQVQHYDLPISGVEGGAYEERFWKPVNAPLLGPDGQVQYIIHSVLDATNEVRAMRAQDELRETRARLEAVSDASDLGFWTWDVHADCMIADPHVAFFFGVDEQLAAQGTSAQVFIQRVHPNDELRVREKLASALSEGGRYEIEHRVLGFGGEVRWLAARGCVNLANGDRPLTLNGVLLDITERKRLEEALRVSEGLLQQVFAQAPVAIAVFRGRDLIVELANPPYRALLQGRELAGQRLGDVVPEMKEHIETVFQKVFDSGEPVRANELHFRYDQDGDGVVDDHWFNVVYDPLRDAEGTVCGLLVVCSEVTEQVTARLELERVNLGLEEFAYVASHDLQEPLRMVQSYSQLLTRRMGDETTLQQRQYAEFIQRGGRRMEQLIQDLLVYSRTIHAAKEAVPSTEANLDAALTMALCNLETSVAESGATITRAPLPTVRGDMAQLSHVFQNVLSNAIKYRNPAEGLRVHVEAARGQREWVISVRDNGIGFEPDQAERIFGLFQRLHHATEYPGTGLGLAICRRIVERYGGKMWAEGELGTGSVFFISFPVVAS